MLKNKKLKITLISVLSLIVIVWGGSWLLLKGRLPKIDGSIKAPTLSKPVTIVRDSYGVPHIEAANANDAYFALGFTVAGDRLFQMELQRRLAQGELAEILGPALIPVDQRFRTFGYRRAAQVHLDSEEKSAASKEALKLLDQFLAGVNYYIETQKLPIEYSLLGATARPFTKLDVMSMMAYMSFTFANGHTVDPIYSAIKDNYSVAMANELFPGYTKEKPITIIETEPKFNSSNQESAVPPLSMAGPNLLFSWNNYLRNIVSNMVIQKLSVESLVASIPVLHGSNSWVIGPSRSVSGGAILANDPHISISNPDVWYEAHIKYEGFENYGYYIPIFPFPLLGHNYKRAWALTMFENDDLDLYRETFDPNDSTKVKYKGQWVPVEVVTEKIKVKGQVDAEVKIQITRHGPIITDYLKGYKGEPISMFWVLQHEHNPIIQFIYEMLTAKNIKEFEKPLALLSAPGLNISYADNEGNIGWWAVGKVPIRPKHADSREIHDGASGKDEIQGYVPFAQNPHLVNPPSGIIVTANNLSTTKPVGPIQNLEGYWAPTDRATRLTELLSARQKWDLDSLKLVQTDVHAINAKRLINEVVGLIQVDELSENEAKALEQLKAWNSAAKVDSVGTTIYEMFMYYILKDAIQDELGEDHFKLYADTLEHWQFLKTLVFNDSSPFWNDVSTPESESRQFIVNRAFKRSVADLSSRLGSNPNSWQWGKLHKIEYQHPLGSQKPLNLLFNIGPYPSPGSGHIVNRLKSDNSKQDYLIASNPSTRRLIDFANVDSAVSILPSGNSGNFMSHYYDDQVQMYLDGKYRPMLLNFDQIKEDSKHTVTLQPALSN
ncbi:MAG: penicillin acylase family protein [Leptonema sp. (in: Bacteria)]|nr:penicillin acylase family protein [Leptonema sp. (in: bacteria)]